MFPPKLLKLPPMEEHPQGKYVLGFIPEGPDGIRITLEVMRRLAKQYKSAPEVRELAIALTNGLDAEDWAGEVSALFYFVRDQIRYVLDVNEVETVQSPSDTLRLGAGDCDDKSTLLASLLESIGHPARFAALAFQPDNFEHVLVETEMGRHWIALETTQPVAPGWYPEGVINKMLRHI